jgi:hypothetical protein
MLLIDADPYAVWGFWVAIVAAVAAIIAAVAAIWTLVYAKDAPTKEDLARVEENTAESSTHLEKVHTNISRMDERLHRQSERESIISQANRVSFTVQGMGDAGGALEISLLVRDPDVVLKRIEFFNEFGTLFGSVDCEKVEPLAYKATLDALLAQRWYNGGTADQVIARKRLYLRAYMVLRGEEVYRQFPIHMSTDARNVGNLPGVFATVFIVDGNV